MLVIAQRVDDVQFRSRCRKFLEQPLGKRADDDRVHPAVDVARDICHRLAPAERGVRVKRDHVAAELVHGNLEG